MKLNCDMGESYGAWQIGRDTDIMPYVNMASIACGYHASDPQIMHATVKLALMHNVTIGAHPSYPDLQGFGRRAMAFSHTELINIVLYQVGALQAICDSLGTNVRYIKPHGALYNQMMADFDTFQTILQAIALLQTKVPLVIMALPPYERKFYLKSARAQGVELIFEAFADRAYNEQYRLVSRNVAGSSYQNVTQITTQAHKLILKQPIPTITGKMIVVDADTICVHGDGPVALAAVQAIHSML